MTKGITFCCTYLDTKLLMDSQQLRRLVIVPEQNRFKTSLHHPGGRMFLLIALAAYCGPRSLVLFERPLILFNTINVQVAGLPAIRKPRK